MHTLHFVLLSMICLFSGSVECATKPPKSEAIATSDFVSMCKDVATSTQDSAGSYKRSACVGYVVGFLESAGFLTYLAKIQPRYCIPVGVSPMHIVRLALRNSAKRPQQKDQPAAFLLRNTLETEFPCPN